MTLLTLKRNFFLYGFINVLFFTLIYFVCIKPMIFNLTNPGSFPLGSITIQMFGMICLSALIAFGIRSLIKFNSSSDTRRETQSYVLSALLVLFCFILVIYSR